MDYRASAEELLGLLFRLRHQPVNERISRLIQGELFVLSCLYRCEPLLPKELCRTMAVSSARMAALLHHMEEKGLICRRHDTADGRQVLVRLTAAGRAYVESARGQAVEAVAEVLAALGPEDAERLLALQRRVLAVLSARP